MIKDFGKIKRAENFVLQLSTIKKIEGSGKESGDTIIHDIAGPALNMIQRLKIDEEMMNALFTSMGKLFRIFNSEDKRTHENKSTISSN